MPCSPSSRSSSASCSCTCAWTTDVAARIVLCIRLVLVAYFAYAVVDTTFDAIAQIPESGFGVYLIR